MIAINILNFDFLKQTVRFHTTYHFYEDRELFKLTDVMEFHFLEMPKLIKDWKQEKLDPWNDLFARWMLLLGIVDHRNGKVYEDIYKELEAIAINDETSKTAFQSWDVLSSTHEEVLAYEACLKQVFDEEAARREAELREQEALERGRKEGREKGILLTARRMLQEGLDVETVAKITELTVEQVQAMKDEMNQKMK